MAHFYGTLQGARGQATRCGSKSSGMLATAARWQGAVRVRLYVGPDGRDWVRVDLLPWRGVGVVHNLYHGPIGTYAPDGILPGEG